jgi:hypothetical protein
VPNLLARVPTCALQDMLLAMRIRKNNNPKEDME